MMRALAMPATTPEQVARRERAIAAARASGLAAAQGRPVSSSLMSRVDQVLGLPAADPTLGLGRR
jgi:hypothetical protein